MYLWKYWRESRIAFLASLIGIAIMLVFIYKGHPLTIEPPPSFAGIAGVLPVALALESVPIIFLAWSFGSFGVGRDLGEKSGSFLFSRPRSLAFFVWRDWGFGLAQLLVIVIGVNMVLGFEFYRLLVSLGDPYHGSFLLSGRPVPLAVIVALNCVGGFLLAALVFGLTYCSTVLVRNVKGVMLGAGVLLSYIVLKEVVSHYWPWISLPTVIPQEFAVSPPSQTGGRAVIGLVDNLGLFLSIRFAVILLFPFAAQFLLQKRDIE